MTNSKGGKLSVKRGAGLTAKGESTEIMDPT